ncbi:MAG: hypothetical protein V1922_01345 [bacterium]
MKIESIKKDIAHIEQLLSNIKKSLDINNDDEKVYIAGNTNKNRKKPVGVKENILDYINKGFFDQPKTSQDIMMEFKKRALTGYTPSAISMALMLLVRTGTLERNGEGKSKSPWSYKKI